jgi:hypothetical protein
MDVLVLDGKTASEESEGQGPLYQSNEEGGGTSSGEGDQDHGSHRRPLQGQDALTQEEYLQYHMQKNAEMIERMQQLQHDESRDSQQMVQENLWR